MERAKCDPLCETRIGRVFGFRLVPGRVTQPITKGLRSMKHIRSISRVPTYAADIPISVLVEFIISFLTAIVPLLEAKNPSTTTPVTTTTT